MNTNTTGTNKITKTAINSSRLQKIKEADLQLVKTEALINLKAIMYERACTNKIDALAAVQMNEF